MTEYHKVTCSCCDILSHKLWNITKLNICCHKGHVKLMPRHRFPAFILNKMCNPHDSEYKNFEKTNNNGWISFISMGAKFTGNSPGHGSYSFRDALLICIRKKLVRENMVNCIRYSIKYVDVLETQAAQALEFKLHSKS